MTSLRFVSTRREGRKRERWKWLCGWIGNCGGNFVCFAIMVPDLEPFQGNEDGDILMRREMGASDLFEEDKENMSMVLEDVVGSSLSLQRSPLPVGYPRSPLQDITAVLSSLNVCFFWLSLSHFVCGSKFYTC